jgi:hypothetical protein
MYLNAFKERTARNHQTVTLTIWLRIGPASGQVLLDHVLPPARRRLVNVHCGYVHRHLILRLPFIDFRAFA